MPIRTTRGWVVVRWPTVSRETGGGPKDACCPTCGAREPRVRPATAARHHHRALARLPPVPTGVSRETERRLEELAHTHDLPPGSVERLRVVLGRVATEPSAITTVRDPALAVEVHIRDSLDGLRVPELRAAQKVADLGSGGGGSGALVAAPLAP